MNMKSSAIKASLLAVTASAGLIAAALAATAPAVPTAMPAPHADPDMGSAMQGEGMRHGMRGGPEGGRMRGPMSGMMDPFLMAVHQLDLTPEQHQSVRSLLDGARQSQESEMQHLGENLAVLGNPGDPGYAATVQAAKNKATAMIQQRSDLDVQIYAVLTADQKAKLPKLLTDMKSKFDQRREQWQKHAHDGAAAMPKH